MIFGLIEEDLLRLSFEKAALDMGIDVFFISPLDTNESWETFYRNLTPKLLIVQSDASDLLDTVGIAKGIPIIYISDKSIKTLKNQDRIIVPPISFKQVKEILNGSII